MHRGSVMGVRIQILTLLVGISACAQNPGAIGGYTLGYVFDGRSSDLKPLVGIPGAAVLGAELDAGVAIRQAYMSPRQNYAVALTDGGAVVVSWQSATDPPVVAPLGLDSTAAGLVALSPDGSAGAFYSVNEAMIRVVTGLPATPVIARSVPAGAVSGTIRLLAINNDASQVVVAADGDGSGSLILLDPDGNGRTLTTSTHMSALQFVGDSKDLLLADDADDTVSMVQDVPGSAVWKPLAAAGDGIAGPIGLNVSLDGKLVIVANGRAGNVFAFDPNGPQRDTYACPCTPAGLSRLNGNSVFLLNDVSDSGPLWIFDGDSATRRVVFIPTGQTGAAGSGQ